MGLLEQLLAAQEALKAVIEDTQLIVDQAKAEGFADGVASRDDEVADLKLQIEKLSIQGDKIFSQVELDAAVAGAVEPLKSQIADLQAQLDAVPAQIEVKIAEAVAAVKVELASKLEAAEQDNLAIIAELKG